MSAECRTATAIVENFPDCGFYYYYYYYDYYYYFYYYYYYCYDYCCYCCWCCTVAVVWQARQWGGMKCMYTSPPLSEA